jgi:hypothetical protein
MRSRFACYIVLTSVALLNWVCVQGCTQDTAQERVDIVTTIPSPNKEYLATVYVISGGGAAGYVYKLINMRKREEPFDSKKGIIFLVTRTRALTLTWQDNQHVTVKHSKPDGVYTKANLWDSKIHISYVEE